MNFSGIVNTCLWQSRVFSIIRKAFQKAGDTARKGFSSVMAFWKDSGLKRGLARLEDGRQRLTAAYPLHPVLGKGLEMITLLYCLLMPVLKDWAGVVLVLAIQWFFRPKSLGITPFGRRLAVLAGTMGIASVFSGGLIPGWKALYTAMTGLALAGLSAWFFTPARQEKFVRLFLCFAPVWLLIGYWQYAYGGRIPLGWLEPDQYQVIAVRIGSVFGNPNLYAMYLVILLALAIEWLHRPGQPWPRLFYRLVAAAAVWSLYWTYSRTGWIIGGVILGWYCRNLWRRPVMGWAALLAGGILLLQSGSGLARLAGFWQVADTTLGYRVRIWQGVFWAIAKYWLWGAGPDSFGRIYPWFQIENVWAVHAHQWLLQFWLEYGIFSLFALLWMLKWFYDLARSSRPRLWLLPIMAVLGFGLVESWQVSSLMNGLFWLMAGMMAAYDKGNHENDERSDFWLLRQGKFGG